MEKILTYNRMTCILLLVVMYAGGKTFAQTTTTTTTTTSERPTIKTIVIDAGHGGKDPGCHGAVDNEKHVCLNIALKLGDKIKKKYPGIKVVYTRDKDVFVELDERANIANKAKADLFICIHANSASPAAYGAETYVLGLHRTESQKAIAERENSTIYLEDDKGEKYKDFDMSPDAIIARQLQLSVFLDQSILFADNLQTEFLTNPAEEKFLADTTGQRKMAASMFAAFESYKNELEGIDGKTTESSSQSTNTTTNPTVSTAVENSLTNDKVIFRVQIETSETKIASTSPKFKGLSVYEYKQDNLYKYTAGRFEDDFKAANNYKNELREQGFQHAFVVAFQNGERINLEKAIKLAEK